VLRSKWDAAEAVVAGRMERVTADWAFGSAPIVVLVPKRKGLRARVQALIRFLVDATGAKHTSLEMRLSIPQLESPLGDGYEPYDRLDAGKVHLDSHTSVVQRLLAAH
jgi:hypothetical protein